MGTSFKAVVFRHHRRQDGTFAVKIRMIHNGKSKYMATDVVVSREQLSRSLDRITDQRVVDLLDARLRDFRSAASSIEGSEWMTADQLWDAVQERLRHGHGFTLDFFAFSREVIATKEKGTQDVYLHALRCFEDYLGKDTIEINDVTYPLLLGFRSFIERRNGRGCRSASLYLSCLRHVHNVARDRYNDPDTGALLIPRQPFRKGLIPPEPVTEHRALTVGQVKAIRDCQPVTARGRLARDVFMLSFATVGTNTADLFLLRPSDLRDGVIEYRRAKTDSKRADHAFIRIRLEQEAAEVVRSWGGRSSLLSFAERYADFRSFNKAVNLGLREVAALCGIARLTSYHARHTWATLAANTAGVDFDLVQQALNHARRGGDRVTSIYVERDFSRIWDANRKVLDLLK